tara:strand:+ start:62 stop:304 length:243 start_codon:yes stop_codon:yes gene_type:complete
MYYYKQYNVHNYKTLLNRLFSEDSAKALLTPQQQVEIRTAILKSGVDGHFFDNLIVKAKKDEWAQESAFPKNDFRIEENV